MRPQNDAARARLIAEIRRSTPARAKDVAQRLGVGITSFHRLMAEQERLICAAGGSRNRRYGIRRPLRGGLGPFPVYRVDQNGRGHDGGAFELLEPTGSLLDMTTLGYPVTKERADGWWDGLPYPFYDMKPQGFLGRHFARMQHAALEIPDNPNLWDDADILYVLTQRGTDTPGDLIVGHRAYEHWLERVAQPEQPVQESQHLAHYAACAEQASRAGVAGSSAGGEFPKFTAIRALAGARTPHVLVKFSGAEASNAVRRWSDLLVCEHLALETLRDCGQVAASTRILEAEGRVFLEVERTDRHELFGRSGTVSLAALNGAFVGSTESEWPRLVHALEREGLVEAGHRDSVAMQWWFGQLIANTDMHKGNLSFQLAPTAIPQFRPAPAYDMLPMRYVPFTSGEVPEVEFVPQAPLPAEREPWNRAAEAACQFWQRAAGDSRISTAFRGICQANLTKVQSLRERV